MADSKALFVLHETAAGYGLFTVVSFEEIGAMLDGVSNTVVDLATFSRAVKLHAFQPFESAQEALENINAISEHSMTSTLKNFLEMNLPSGKKKSSSKSSSDFSLGVIETGLATAISTGLPSVKCRSDDTVREIARGVRCHLTHFVKGLDASSCNTASCSGEVQAQLGLGHSYSRGKVKFNPARSDNMIIQSIALLDQMDKDLNTFAMRVREWYSWHFPELKDLVKDNYMFARCAALIQNKSSLFTSSSEKKSGKEDEEEDGDTTMDVTKEDKLPTLIDIVGDVEVANAVVAAAKTSMGMDCSMVDMVNIVNFTQRMIKLAEYRKQLSIYLSDKMALVAPNLSTLIGDTVAARLISKAGSLTNLAKAPASTVQILGAEKALFRALKTKGNTPKYGLIYHSTFISRADAKNKGRISRYLANKCSIATRIDSFSDDPCSMYGEKLREQVEERLKFYETGANPRKNIDVMEEVSKHLAAGKTVDEKDDVDMDETPKKKKKKDKKKRKSDATLVVDDDEEEEEEKDETPKKSAKKSKKKAKREEDDDSADIVVDTPKSSKNEETTISSEKKSSKKEKKSSKKKKKSKE